MIMAVPLKEMDRKMNPELIGPSTKKLWGVEENKKEETAESLFNLHEQRWREAAWSTSSMGIDAASVASSQLRRPGSFQNGPSVVPGGIPQDISSVLSPRSSETGGLGVKMVEYVLCNSPTKEIEARMRGMAMATSSDDKENKLEKKEVSSPLKELDNPNLSHGHQLVQMQNGLPEEERSYKPTSPSHGNTPVTEEIKNGVIPPNMGHSGKPEDFAMVGQLAAAMGPNGLNMSMGHAGMQNMNTNMGHQIPPSMVNGGMNQTDGQGHFEQVMMENVMPNNIQQQQQMTNYDNNLSFLNQIEPQQGIMAHNLEAQIFRNSAGVQAQNAPQGNPQFQMLAQPQFMPAQQQQQQLAAAVSGISNGAPTFPGGPYVINPQEQPFLFTGPMMPQYYGVPWGMYPAGMIPGGPGMGIPPGAMVQAQQGNAQQRRPLSPSSLQEMAAAGGPTGLPQVPQGYQVIQAYVDQNGSLVMGNMRGVGTGTPVRLVSPAPVVINATGPGAVRLMAAGQQQTMHQPPTPQQGLYGQPTQQQSLYSAGGSSTSALGLQSSQIGSPFGNAAAGLMQNNSLGFGGNNLGGPVGGSPSLSALSGLTGTVGRRDSFDRTSAFSPSLDYNPNNQRKWPQNYGALGTVTASPGPLGGLSGSLTPPPLGLSNTVTSGLQLGLGPIIPGTRVMSAAPGSEMKYRSGALTPNGMFSSANLFGQGVKTRTASGGMDKASGRSRLLEDFRNNRFPNLQLRDLANHVVEFSQDQHGSRFIQQKLERAPPNEKQMIFNEIVAAAYALMTDVFGNYVIQKFFEFGTPEQKIALAGKLRGHVLALALQMYGCRVIQKALESIGTEQQKEIVRELDGHVLKCVKDQNGNHVVQKCIECVEPGALQFVIDAFEGQVFALSTHPYGCRVIQRILEHCNAEQTLPILNELHQNIDQLIQDQYGNYVIQHVLEHGKQEDKSRIVAAVRGKVLTLSQHKFASNVVEKCVTHATRAERAILIDEVIGFNDSAPHGALHTMMKDQFANYVVQKMIDVAEQSQRKILMHKIRPHVSTLRKYTYGKHILAKLEKYFLKNNTDLGPIGPPTNGAI
ncbi:pumilio homolog 2-like isoform X2 [Artemia franciscana]|uniref:pumilio homolog 2-like isoform X2 n=1 Tax=Artemia franciscana TaxID=6661 RepID=UPI0032DA1DF6